MLLVDDSSRSFLSEASPFLESGLYALVACAQFVLSVMAKDGKATAYVCEHFTCQLPSNDPAQVAKLLGIA